MAPEEAVRDETLPQQLPGCSPTLPASSMLGPSVVGRLFHRAAFISGKLCDREPIAYTYPLWGRDYQKSALEYLT